MAPTTLSDLPPEVREMIYKHLFIGRTLTLTSSETPGTTTKRFREQRLTEARSKRFPSAIILASRDCAVEARSMLLKHAVILIEVPTTFLHAKALGSLPFAVLRKIELLVPYYGLGEKYFPALWFKPLFTETTALAQLCLVTEVPTLYSWDDDDEDNGLDGEGRLTEDGKQMLVEQVEYWLDLARRSDTVKKAFTLWRAHGCVCSLHLRMKMSGTINWLDLGRNEVEWVCHITSIDKQAPRD